MTCGLPGFRRACAYTISPNIHETFSFSSSGFQRGSFLKTFLFSPEMGSVANAVAWPSRSGSMNRCRRMPFRLQAPATARRASSSATEHTTNEETLCGLPKCIDVYWVVLG